MIVKQSITPSNWVSGKSLTQTRLQTRRQLPAVNSHEDEATWGFFPHYLPICVENPKVRLNRSIAGEKIALFANHIVVIINQSVKAGPHRQWAFHIPSEIQNLFLTSTSCPYQSQWMFRVCSRFAPSQWETALLCNDVSHWLGTNPMSAAKDKEAFGESSFKCS